MRGKLTLYIDQYDFRYWAKTVQELRSQINNGGSRVQKMYITKKKGDSKHVGYVIGDRWLNAFQPVELPA